MASSNSKRNTHSPSTDAGEETYSTLKNAYGTFRDLLENSALPLPQSVRALYDSVVLRADDGEDVVIPSPWRETEAITALKALEASLAISLGKIRYGIDQTAAIDIDHATVFLFMAYLSTIDGHSKFEPEAIARLASECGVRHELARARLAYASSLTQKQTFTVPCQTSIGDFLPM
jgi:hypothetical protein